MLNIEIVYTFEVQNKEKFVYPISIDKKSGTLILEGQGVPPEWTRLENCQCEACPLNKELNPHCPIAVNINKLVEYFKDMYSTDQMNISVATEERIYFKEAPAQRGLASILGLIMATSGCPIMNFLKPMARFHLPFSTSEETVIRSTSMYLLSQYFVAKKGGKPDMSLDKLNKAYTDIQQVNKGISRRIATVVNKGEAASNAVIILDTFSQLLGIEIEDRLDSLQSIFEGTSA